MAGSPEQIERFVRWIEERAAEDPASLAKIKQSLQGSRFSPGTRERLDREIARIEQRLRHSA